MNYRCLAALVFLTSCSNSDDRARNQIMDTIEASLRLPADADPINKYERYYARLPDGKIRGLYIIHTEGWSEEVSRACIEHDVQEFPCGPNGRVELVSAGQRKWVDDYRGLPGMAGGGCGQVNIEYDTKASKFTRLECNGSY